LPAAGHHLHPLVAETTGTWDPAAAKILKNIARAVAAREQVDTRSLFGELLQEVSVLVRGYRGRAALHRRADAAAVSALVPLPQQLPL